MYGQARELKKIKRKKKKEQPIEFIYPGANSDRIKALEIAYLTKLVPNKASHRIIS